MLTQLLVTEQRRGSSGRSMMKEKMNEHTKGY